MSGSSIGVPQIEPRHRAAWQDPHHPRDADKDKKDDGAGRRGRAPPEPGTGEIVDKAV